MWWIPIVVSSFQVYIHKKLHFNNMGLASTLIVNKNHLMAQRCFGTCSPYSLQAAAAAFWPLACSSTFSIHHFCLCSHSAGLQTSLAFLGICWSASSSSLSFPQPIFTLFPPINEIFQFSSVQLLSCVRLFVIPWIAACQASLSITNSRSLLKLTSIVLVMPSSHLILCRPLLLLPPIPSSIRVFSNESTLHMRWPKYWSFSFSILPMNTQDWSPLGWTVGSPWSPRDSQESSPTPQFKSINSSVLSFLYNPTLTSKHDYWKNHSLD